MDPFVNFVCMRDGCSMPGRPGPHCGSECSGTWYCSKLCFQLDPYHDRLCRKIRGLDSIEIKHIPELHGSMARGLYPFEFRHKGLFATRDIPRNTDFLCAQPLLASPPVVRAESDLPEILLTEIKEAFLATAHSACCFHLLPYDDPKDQKLSMAAALFGLVGSSERLRKMFRAHWVDLLSDQNSLEDNAKAREMARAFADLPLARGESCPPSKCVDPLILYFSGSIIQVPSLVGTEDLFPRFMLELFITKYCNYSCRPNCTLSEHCNELVLTSNRDIKKGEEITLARLSIGDIPSDAKRKVQLKASGLRHCLCLACQKDLSGSMDMESMHWLVRESFCIESLFGEFFDVLDALITPDYLKDPKDPLDQEVNKCKFLCQGRTVSKFHPLLDKALTQQVRNIDMVYRAASIGIRDLLSRDLSEKLPLIERLVQLSDGSEMYKKIQGGSSGDPLRRALQNKGRAPKQPLCVKKNYILLPLILACKARWDLLPQKNLTTFSGSPEVARLCTVLGSMMPPGLRVSQYLARFEHLHPFVRTLWFASRKRE